MIITVLLKQTFNSNIKRKNTMKVKCDCKSQFDLIYDYAHF